MKKKKNQNNRVGNIPFFELLKNEAVGFDPDNYGAKYATCIKKIKKKKSLSV